MLRQVQIQSLRNAARYGLEVETVRTDPDGRMAGTPHPRALGSPLANPFITLDFSETQLEFVTPPFSREASLHAFLRALMAWGYRQIGNELLWPFSMPPRLPAHDKIPLADFGTSAEGGKRMLYREGLKRRYGGAVQTISGIHYNFSLADSFWKAYAKARKSTEPLSVFKDEEYFGLMRNVIRYVPLITYLFGASPAADKSFFGARPTALAAMDAATYYGPYATSLRLSDFGYHNKKNVPVNVSYNSLGEYARDLYRAVSTPSRLWSSLGIYERERQIQLNANILQLENEFYASVRPKQKRHVRAGTVISSLACAGVEYVELRGIDLDPREAAGIGKDQLHFLHAFMLYCALKPSPLFKKSEQKQWERNQSHVALYGRKPGLRIADGLRRREFTAWSLEVLEEIAEVARWLDEAYGTKDFSRAVGSQKEKALDSRLTPSAKILKELRESGTSFADYSIALARGHKRAQRSVRLTPRFAARMWGLSQSSLVETARREARDVWILNGYESLELSTQVLIRAAQKRNVNVRVIDDDLNVIELSRGNKKEIVKQATITGRDNHVTYELMNHKSLTKTFLARAGVSTPRGGYFTAAHEAIAYCAQHRNIGLVIKPASANYGTGVSIMKPKSDCLYPKAVSRAFRYDESILVEEFIPGKEYRFLVIAGKVVAVLNREPANVVGNGKNSIKELVALKNTDPASYKLPEQYIRLGVIEREILAEARLNTGSVPARGKKVYLRKNSNVSDGGDPLDIPHMPQAYKSIAVKAAASVGAHMCGVDMILRNPKIKPRTDTYSVIELNWNPALYLHAYPYRGNTRDVGGAVLDFLGF